jgi:hypothetical protein
MNNQINMQKKGEIIQFPLKKELPQSPDIEKNSVEQYDDYNKLVEDADFLPCFVEMIEYLTSLTTASGAPKRQNIEFRRSLLLDSVTNEELKVLVSNSTRADWQNRPTYYHAIVAELEKRKLIN